MTDNVVVFIVNTDVKVCEIVSSWQQTRMFLTYGQKVPVNTIMQSQCL